MNPILEYLTKPVKVSDHYVTQRGSVADTYGYPASQHINVIVATHKARGGNIMPVSGDHTARARAARRSLPREVEQRPNGCGCTYQRGRHSKHCELAYR